MGGTGAFLTSPVFVVFVTLAFSNAASSASSRDEKTTILQISGGDETRVKRFQISGGDETRVKRFGDRDQSVWISSENRFAEFDNDVRKRQEEFDRRVEQMDRDREERWRDRDRRWNSSTEDFDRMNTLIFSIVIPLGLLGFVVPCIILICCCVPSCPLSRRRERRGMVHNNGNRFGGLPPGSLGGVNVTTTTYPPHPQTTTTTYPPHPQTTTTYLSQQQQGNTNIPLLPPQPSTVPQQTYFDSKGPELPPPYHAAMESTTSSNPDPSAPKILPYTYQPAFNPHAM